MKTLLIALVIGFTLSAHAEGEHGNGGDVVVCRDQAGQIKSVELLDFYEAKLYRNLVIDLGHPTEKLEMKLQTLAARFATRNPELANFFFERAIKFMNDVLFLDNIDLEDIPDSGNVTVQRGCKIEQIAIQKVPRYELDKRYTVNKELWDKLDANHQAGLVWHEVIYGFAAAQGVKNSIAVRYMNALTASNRVHQTSVKDWVQLMLALKISETTISGLFGQIYGNGRMQVIKGEYTFYGKKFSFNKNPRFVDFYDSGKISSVSSGENKSEDFRFESRLYGPIDFYFYDRLTSFFANGALKEATLAADLKIQINKQIIICRKDTAIAFFETGKLQQCWFSPGSQIDSPLLSFSVQVVDGNSLIRFDESGNHLLMSAEGIGTAKIHGQSIAVKTASVSTYGDPIYYYSFKSQSEHFEVKLFGETSAAFSDRYKCFGFSKKVAPEQVSTYSDGQFRSGVLLEDAELFYGDEKRKFEKSSVLVFDRQGRVKEFSKFCSW